MDDINELRALASAVLSERAAQRAYGRRPCQELFDEWGAAKAATADLIGQMETKLHQLEEPR